VSDGVARCPPASGGARLAPLARRQREPDRPPFRRRPYVIRTPAGWAVEAPGDLVQLDTLDIRPLPDQVWKQFTARDIVSRWDTLEFGRRATAAAAAEVLDRLAERMPFPVRAISIDNGSEFMAEFETACQTRGIRLFVLPPRSPKLHGAVERANRTHTEEFYEITDAEPELAAFQLELRAWETVYNTTRPHHSLDYLTPAEYLASVGVDV
jgi:transposase InsO family protein